jgi:hypothetical protein
MHIETTMIPFRVAHALLIAVFIAIAGLSSIPYNGGRPSKALKAAQTLIATHTSPMYIHPDFLPTFNAPNTLSVGEQNAIMSNILSMTFASTQWIHLALSTGQITTPAQILMLPSAIQPQLLYYTTATY